MPMKSRILQKGRPSPSNTPNRTLCSAKILPSLHRSPSTLPNKIFTLSQRQLIPRQCSEKLQQTRREEVGSPRSPNASPLKSFFKRREHQHPALQCSKLLNSKRSGQQLPSFLDRSKQQSLAKERESFSTQPQSLKSANSLPELREYMLVRRIGEGRFGSVYLAVHKRTGFIGAMKVLRKRGIAECPADKREKIQAQIISQIKIQSFLNHPNLVQLYDCFADRAHLYLFVELGCQGPLSALLTRTRILSEEATSLVARELAHGIAYMHANAVLHRDIKLENIVFTHGMAKICDFGWAVYEPQGLRGTLCGTPLYLAPEMLQGREYDSKVDLWALGTLTHELLTSENPFKIASQKQLRRILTEPLVLTIGSPEARSFINFALNKDPQRRPDADILLKHPFIKKYEEIETCEETCNFGPES